MTEGNQPGGDPSKGDIADELRLLGKNLKDALQSVWESDERRRLEEEIRVGLADLGVTLNQAAGDFRRSQAGRQLKEDFNDFRRRVDNGEVSTKVHDELINALRLANVELSKLNKRESGGQTPGSNSASDDTSQ